MKVNKEEMLDILNNNMFPVAAHKDIIMRSDNGLVDKAALKELIQHNFTKEFAYVTTELTTSKLNYPKDNQVKVELDLRCVVISMEDYKRLRFLLEGDE